MKTLRAYRTITWVTAATCILCHHERAHAWDSQQDAHTPSLSEQSWQPAFGLRGQFRMHVFKDAIGNQVEKLLRCRASILGPGGTVEPDCEIATPPDIALAKAGWLTARVGGEVPHTSEHTLIARAAAQRAGLVRDAGGGGPSIFEPFWLRYPARNALVGSNIQPSETPPPNAPPPDLLVGQSFLPLALNQSSAAFVSRNVSLLELAQLPDFSNSLADWAMGNETCPISGAEHAYKNVGAVEACHQFTAVMGAINVTHFRPLNHDMWQHYHGLALSVMAECRSYSGIKDEFYGYLAQELNGMSDAHTEAHECERLAMAYEMFAQHFLQDAWSSGHMWMPWGSPRFSDFPSGVDVVPNDASPEFGPRSESARRALIAAMTGAVRGMIHGAKSLTTALIKDNLWFVDPADLASNNVFDDPLNGGRYTIQNDQGDYVDRDVLWRGAGGTLAPAAGDLFWNPSVVTGKVVSQQAKYLRQREGLLNCAASSMLEVYSAGPRAHGQELPAASSLDGINPNSDYCWNQWATNESMLAAMGPVSLRFSKDLRSLQTLLGLINGATFDQLRSAIVDYPLDLNEESELFRERVLTRLMSDVDHITQVYLGNADDKPDGIQSAQQYSIYDPSSAPSVTLFGMLPLQSSQSGAPRDVDYVDRGLPTLSSTDAEQALSRMFWRGDLKTTCSLGGLEALKQKCVLATTLGGDPDACTQCVALAELHIPRCSADPTIPTRPSKCSMVGAESGTSGGPDWWWSSFARWFPAENLPRPFNTNDWNACAEPLEVALAWCTDAPSDISYLGDFRSRRVAVGAPTHTEYCNPFDNTRYTWGTSYWRGSRFLLETDPSTGTWLYPLALAYDYSVTTTPGPNACESPGNATTSRDSVMEQVLGFPGLSSYRYWFGPGAEVPRWGITDRTFYWANDCYTALNHLPDAVTSVVDYRDTRGADCRIRSLHYERSCPRGFRGTAGGECSAIPGPAPSIVFLDVGRGE